MDTTDLDLFMFWNVRPRLDANKENRGPAFWMAGKVFWPCQKMFPLLAIFTDVFRIGILIRAKMAREVRCIRLGLEFQADTGGVCAAPWWIQGESL